jgi:translation initiation factor IF-2
MAKKRVHEIAKERGISSKEVLAVLQKAGLDVKAAASSVDEDDIARAFSNGAESAAAEQPKAEAAPAGDGVQAREKPTPRQPEQPEQQPQQGDGGQRPQRPQRRPEQGGGAGGRRRRVVIDSQASRRPQGPPPVQQPPRRGRGRRRRTPWVEPDLTAQPEPQQEEPATQINSGATVKEVAESLGLSAADVIKELMELGEMATMTQTLADDAVEVLADAFEKKIELVHAD